MGDQPVRLRLRELLRSFIAAATHGSFSDVRALQRPPHGSLCFGAPGVVAALLQHGARTADRSQLRLAGRWMREITMSRASTLTRGFEAEPYSRSSFWFGAAGIHYVRIVTALANGDRATARRAIGTYLEHATSPERSHDVVMGAAGNLIAISLIAIELREPSLEEVAGKLAEQVMAELVRFRSNWSFAHGWPGLAFAVLQHCRATSQPVPTTLLTGLRAQVESDPPRSADRERWAQASWCNGTAGHVLLWVKAFELTQDSQYLERARADAASLPRSSVLAGLCCGAPGWAYAHLALERVAPGEGWYERALRTGIDFVASNPQFVHASGLLQGQSGVVCLATDLLYRAPGRGIPFIEALPARISPLSS